MELLLDTDFLIKMGRYRLLNEFESLMMDKGHKQPYRHLAEVWGKIYEAQNDPIKSEFGSQVAFNIVKSFITDGKSLGSVVDKHVIKELDKITGIDPGEKLLVEYALRTTDTVIFTGDKNFIIGLGRMDIPMSKKYRPKLINRIHHLEHVLWDLAQINGWKSVQSAVTRDEECDSAIFSNLSTNLWSEAQASDKLHKSICLINLDANGTTPANL